MNMKCVGITERGDAGINFSWVNKTHECEGMILITKHLSPRFIQEAAKVNCIIHATITGYGGSIYEPNVKSWEDSALLFKELIQKVGAERVVLRIDPIIPSKWELPFQVYKALHMNAKEKTRVRISFLDNYPHVKARFQAAGLKPEPYNFHADLQKRKAISTYFPDAEICGEPGMPCTGCVSEADLKVLKIPVSSPVQGTQRPACKCLTLKKELLNERKQCPSGCLYCYWQ